MEFISFLIVAIHYTDLDKVKASSQEVDLSRSNYVYM